jgi:integrase
MASECIRLNDRVVSGAVFPEATKSNQLFIRDSDTRGLSLRVTTGAKSFVFQGKLAGQSLRVTIGDAKALRVEKARKEARRLQALIDQKIDPRDERKQRDEEIKAKRERDELTVAAAFAEYVEGKRRKSDGLPLKNSTKTEYLAMVAAPRVLRNGKKSLPGILHCIASIPLADLTADQIRKAHAAAEKRGMRRAAYAAQALRAVLNWHGVSPLGNPFSPTTAGKHRIAIPPARPSKKPIRADRLGEFWNALGEASSEQGRDYFRFLLLTGLRVTEPMKIRVDDCDLRGGRFIVRDTKNRKDHEVLMSRQVAEIVARRIAGKSPEDRLFDLVDGKKTKEAVIAALAEQWRPKDMRSTFASVAATRCYGAVLKRLMNHSDPGDVTDTHYVELTDEDVRAGWQSVADFIEAEGRKAAASAEVVCLEGARQKRAGGVL